MSARDPQRRLHIMKDRLRAQQARAKAESCDCAVCTLRRVVRAGGIGKKLADGMVEIQLDELGLTPESLSGLTRDELVERVLKAASGGPPANTPKH
jgi:hypothetical protein